MPKNNHQLPCPPSAIARVLCLLLLCRLATADCPLSYYPRQTVVGSIIANIDSRAGQQSPQLYFYPLLGGFKATAQVKTAISVIGFGLEKNSLQFGYRVEASYSQQDVTGLQFRVQTGTSRADDRWTYIEFKFLMSDAPEILVGSKNILEMSPTHDESVFQVQHQVDTSSLNFNYRATARIFISGVEMVEKRTLSDQSIAKIDETIAKIQSLRNYEWNSEILKRFTQTLSSQKNIGLRLGQPEFLQNNVLTFQIETTQVQVRYISFSYLVYLERRNEDSLYKSISGSFVATDQDRFAFQKLSNDQMMLVGLSGLSYPIGASVFGLKVEEAQKASGSFFLPSVDGGLASFNLQFFAIETLAGAVCKNCPGSPIVFSQFCVSECPYGYATNVNSDGSFYCQKCDIENMLVPGEDRTKCVCASNHYLVAPTQSCSICPYDCLTCNGNVCLTCDTPVPTTFRTLNRASSRCECLSPGLYDDVGRQARTCVRCNVRCLTCMGPEMTQCTSCLPSRTLNNGICGCNVNFVEVVSGECVCQSPYSLSMSGRCQLVQNKCNANQALAVSGSERACNCVPGYIRSIVSNRCIKQCQSYEEMNYATETCECKAGLVRNSSSSICYSCSGRLNQVYSQQSMQCECMDGFEANRAGNCVACTPRSFFNPRTDRCECIFNYYQTAPNGPCFKCTSSTQSPSCTVYSGIAGADMSASKAYWSRA